MIFTLDDFKHIFRAFFTAAFYPDFYDLCNACFKKFHVVLDKSVLKMPAGKSRVILEDFVVVIISQLEIGLVEDLIVPDMPE